MSTPRSPFCAFCLRLAPALVLLGAGSVHATVYTVGTGGGCSHADLQTAATTAESSSPDGDVIRVSSEIYNQQQVTIFADQDLEIIGGYSGCGATEPTANSRAPQRRRRVRRRHHVPHDAGRQRHLSQRGAG